MNEFLANRGLGFLTVLPTGCTLLVLIVAAPAMLVAAVAALGFVVFLIGALFGLLSLDRAYGAHHVVQVKGHAWERSIDVEEARYEEDSDWCVDVPDNARVTSRKEKFHHRERRRLGREVEVYKYCSSDLERLPKTGGKKAPKSRR